MEVILSRDVERLGKAGAVLKVRDGFARNFLLPNGLAVLSTPGNLKKVEQEKQKKLLDQAKVKKESDDLKDKLANVSLTIPVLTKEDESLYGGISSADLARALGEEGFSLDKNSIVLDEPIRALGIYEVPIRLPQDVSAKVKVWIVKK